MMSSRPDDYGKAARWSLPALTEEEQRRVEEAMETQARRKGGVTEQNAAQVVRCKAVERVLAGSKISATDAAWAWVAQEQTEGRITQQVSRKLRGSTSLAEPFWQAAA